MDFSSYHEMSPTVLCLLLICISNFAVTQRTYDLVFERFVKVMIDPDYFKNVTFRVSRVNRTHMVLNGQFEVMKQVDQLVQYTVHIYERKSGTDYKRGGVQLKDKIICDYFNREEKGIVTPEYTMIEHFMTFTNLPKDCPIPQGKYHVKNYVLDPDIFPPYIPGRNWRADIFITREEMTISHVQIYVRVEPIKSFV